MSDTTIRQNMLQTLLANKLFVLALRLFLGGLFIYSSLDKVQHPDQFAFAIRGYKMLPLGFTSLFALLIAWSELIAGVLLVVGFLTRQAAAAVLILLVMFCCAISFTIIKGIAVDCGCFSNEGGHTTGYSLVIRNLFLIAGAYLVMRFDQGFIGISGLLGKARA